MRMVSSDRSRIRLAALFGCAAAFAAPALAFQENTDPSEPPALDDSEIIVETAPAEDDPIAALLRSEASALAPPPTIIEPVDLAPVEAESVEAAAPEPDFSDFALQEDEPLPASLDAIGVELSDIDIVDAEASLSPEADETAPELEDVNVENGAAIDPALLPVEPFVRPTLAENQAAPPMWRMADEDSEIWLLGTFHILPAELDWRSDPLARAADAAEVIYFEAEVDTQAAQQKTLKILMTEGFNPKGVTLTNMLGDPHAQKLQTVVEELKLPIAAIDPMRPWQAFLTLSVQFIVNQGFDPGSGVETILIKEARARGRELRFFETVEQQIGFFTALSPEAEKNLLVMTLAEWEAQEAEFSALFEAWRHGDAEALNLMMNEQMAQQAPAVYETLIVQRNKAWAEQIEAEMGRANKVLVAVGAAHLVGEDSLPAMMREKGFTVERFGAGE